MNPASIQSNSPNDKDIDGNSSSSSIIKTLSLTKISPNGKLRSLLTFSSNGNGRVAVDDLNLAVPRGAVYGYLGPNGAGKTTTIKMLAGLPRPTRGTASICGHTIHDDLKGAQKHLGYVPDTVHRSPA
jgi:ABC-type multidrug transport system ATPase subunit